MRRVACRRAACVIAVGCVLLLHTLTTHPQFRVGRAAQPVDLVHVELIQPARRLRTSGKSVVGLVDDVQGRTYLFKPLQPSVSHSHPAHEVAASALAAVLGLSSHVPQTVMRTDVILDGRRQTGSLTPFMAQCRVVWPVEPLWQSVVRATDDPSTLQATEYIRGASSQARVRVGDYAAMHLFDFLTGNLDRYSSTNINECPDADSSQHRLAFFDNDEAFVVGVSTTTLANAILFSEQMRTPICVFHQATLSALNGARPLSQRLVAQLVQWHQRSDVVKPDELSALDARFATLVAHIGKCQTHAHYLQV